MTKRFFFSLFSFLIFLLPVACKNATGNAAGPSAPGAGYGRVSLYLKTPARTVLPSLVFDKYVYTFTRVSTVSGTIRANLGGTKKT